MILTLFFGLLKLTNYFFCKMGYFWPAAGSLWGVSLRHSSFFHGVLTPLNEGLGGHEPRQAPSSCDSHNNKKRGKIAPFAALGPDL